MHRLALLDRVSPADFFDYNESGRPIRLKREALENRELMSLVELDISFDENGNLARARVRPKNPKVLELLGKHVGVGAFVERVQVDDHRDLAQQIRSAQARVRQMRAARGLAPTAGDAELVSGG